MKKKTGLIIKVIIMALKSESTLGVSCHDDLVISQFSSPMVVRMFGSANSLNKKCELVEQKIAKSLNKNASVEQKKDHQE